MGEDFIDYGRLIDDSMRSIVKKALVIVNDHGLEGEHHFYLTFQTRYPGVMISDKLLEKYPDEMTVILQHQFWELEVDDISFSVVLSFDNAHESLTVPFDALTSFADPSVKFGLQFRRAAIPSAQAAANSTGGDKKHNKNTKSSGKSSNAKDSKFATNKGSKGSKSSNVVMLDTFRSNK